MKIFIRFAILLAFIIVAAQAASQTMANAQGGLAGSVLDPGNRPVSGVEVFIIDFNTATADTPLFEAGTQTRDDGSYEFFDIPAGSYVVGVAGGDTNFINEFFDDVSELEFANPVNVADGATTSGINFVLKLGGSISGLVVDANNRPVVDMFVGAEDFNGNRFVGGAVTDATGRYRISGLPVGTYRINVEVFGTNFIGEYFDNVRNFDRASPVNVSAGVETGGINFTLETGGSISGVVLDSANLPIVDIEVVADHFTDGQFAGAARTDEAGRYRIAGLAQGRYKARVEVSGTSFVAEYFDNTTNFDLASPIAVQQGANTPGINFTLEIGGSISGVVLDVNGNPVPDIFVAAENFDTNQFVNGAGTDQNGRYTIFGLPPGSYRIHVDTFGTPFINQYFNNVQDFDLATRVNVTPGANTPNINFSLASGGSISGVVLDSANNPIAGINVTASNFDTHDFINGSQTDESGRYRIAGLPAGGYRVNVETSGTNFASEFFDNVSDSDLATRVNVNVGADTPGINFNLASGGSISGVVLDANNRPVPDVFIDANDFDTESFINGATTDSRGNYTISGLPTGMYRIKTNAENTNLINEYFNNVTDFDLASPVNVTAGQETSGINFNLDIGGSISGRITESGGAAISNINVEVEIFATGQWVNSARTDDTGAYSVSGLPNGIYKVRTNAEGTSFINKYFDNVLNFDNASPVNVKAGGDTAGINFVLEPGGAISGTVLGADNQPIERLFVSAEDFDGGFFVNGAETDSSGKYVINGLPAGKYRVRTNGEGGFVNEFFNDTVNDELAQAVTVTVGADTPDINFVLGNGGSISGTILDSNNQPISDVNIDVENFETGNWIAGSRTDSSGKYKVNGIPTGAYKVRTNAEGTNFTNEYFDNASDFDSATAVNVTAGSDTPGINFVLSKGGSISGVVLDTSNNPIPGIRVDAEDFNQHFHVNGAKTDVNGAYIINGLPTGDYRIRTNAEGTDFVNKFFNNVVDDNLAAPVKVTSPNNTPNINFRLEKGGSISGLVVDDDNSPISNIHVEVEFFESGRWVNSARTDSAGKYLVRGLPAGNFRVRTNAEGTNFINKYFENTTDFDLAGPVKVTVGQETADINFALEIGGSVSGTVQDANNQPIAGVNVDAEDFNKRFHVNGARTDSKGNYTITGLPTDEYRIRTHAKDTNFINEFFDNVVNDDLALPVKVTAPAETSDINFVLDSGGSISGTVLGPDNKPVIGINVNAEDFDGNFHVNNAQTGADGKFSITGLPSGKYRVGVDTFETEFVPQFFNNAVWDTADAVIAQAPGDTSNINFTLIKGSFIRGKVTDETNNPISGMSVDAFTSDTDQWVNFGVTNANGAYSITVPPGSYRVGVSTFGSNFLPEFYNNATTSDKATTIQVTDKIDAININFSLSKGNLIKGRVTDKDNNPIRGLSVNALDSFTRDWINGRETDSNGEYSIPVLPGEYVVQVETFGTNFAPGLREGVVVAVGKDTTDINFTLSKASSIRGKVIDEKGAPLFDIFVSVMDEVTEEFINFGVTNSNGEYAIPVLPGSYLVQADTFGTKFVQPPRKIALVVADVDTLGVDFVLELGDVISGNVSDKNGAPIARIFVNAFEFNSGFWVGGDETDSNGDYEIPLLPGTYKIGVDTFESKFAPELYNGKGWDDADPVILVKGADTANIDFVLSPASFISGIVKDVDGNPIAGISLDVSDAETEFWVSSGETDKEGKYTAPVRPGSYVVRTFAGEQGFADKYYNNKTDFDTADHVEVVGEGKTLAGISFILTKGGSISGKVTDDSTGVSGVEVNAFEFNSDSWISSGRTDVNGAYTINGLPAGFYRVRAEDPEGRFPGEFYNGGEGTPFRDQAAPVKTLNEQDTGGIDLELSQGGSISGTVTDGASGLNQMTVEAFEFATGLWVNAQDTDATGAYSITLPDGDYRLRAFDQNGDFAAKYYDNVGGWNEANPVTAQTNTPTEGINFELSKGGFISGEVKDDKNRLLKGVNIDVFNFENDDWVNSSQTDKNGKYKVPVLAGKYRVGAIPADPSFTPIFFNAQEGNVPSWDDASPVSVSETANIENVNFRLSRGGIIAGKVVNANGNGLPGISVQAFDFDTDSWINENSTDSNGNFRIPAPQGRYRIWAQPRAITSLLSSEFYDNKPGWDLATLVLVTNNETTTLNDIELSSGQSISGAVMDDDNKPLAGANIDVFSYDFDFWITFAETDQDGKYAVRGLRKGDYRVQASPPEDSGLMSEFFDNTADWDTARRVRISSGDVSGIDFTLSNAGLITGRVTVENSDRTISGIEVAAYNLDNDAWINSGITDGNGNYSVLVLPGTYLLRATAEGTEFVDEFFDDVVDRDAAKPVVVTLGKNAIANFQLTEGGRITGRVIDGNSEGIAGAEVNAINFDTNTWVNNASTDSNGDFSIAAPSGRYRLQIEGPIGSDFVDEFFDNESSFTNATPVTVSAPEEINLSDIVLTKGRGFIEGNVNGIIGGGNVPLEGIKITALEFDTDLRVAVGFTDNKGEYTLSVPPGSYRLFTSSFGTTTVLINQFFDGAVTAGSATAVKVSPSQTEEADFNLDVGNSIKGRVRSADDPAPLAGVDVLAFQFDTAEWIGNDNTDINGNYSIAVPDGVYRIWALPRNVTHNGKNLGFQFFNNTDSFDNAKNISVNGADKTDINFDLVTLETEE